MKFFANSVQIKSHNKHWDTLKIDYSQSKDAVNGAALTEFPVGSLAGGSGKT